MEAKTIQKVYIGELEVLSPVHIGNGKRLRKGLDFFVSGKNINVINIHKLMGLVMDKGQEALRGLSSAIEENRVQEWLSRNGIRIEDVTRHFYTVTHNTLWEIHSYIRSGLGHPIIPGSSIKGAFRTALVYFFTKSEKGVIKKEISKILEGGRLNLKFADSKISKGIFGRDPNHNLMRSLLVGDFTLTQGTLFIPTVYVYSLNDHGKFMRHKTKNKKNDMKIYPESLSKGAKVSGEIGLDIFLINNARSKRDFYSFNRDFELGVLIDALNRKSMDNLETEIAFLKTHGGENGEIRQVVDFYGSLLKEIKGLEANQAVFQMAWGSGWRGMTGPLLTDDDLTDDLRNKLSLAPNRLSFPFPKTRKIAMTPHGAMPFGWVKLTCRSKDDVKEQKALEIQRNEEARLYPWKEKIKDINKINDLSVLARIFQRDKELIKWSDEIEEVRSCIKSKVKELVEKSASTIQDWGGFKQIFLENDVVKRWAKEAGVSHIIFEAAMVVARKAQRKHKWDEKREESTKDFFTSIGEEWHFLSGEAIDAEKTNNTLQIISSLDSWNDFCLKKVKIKKLDLDCCKALKEKFQKWGLKKSKDKTQRKAYSSLVKRIRILEKGIKK